jgi:hypothetical protein
LKKLTSGYDTKEKVLEIKTSPLSPLLNKERGFRGEVNFPHYHTVTEANMIVLLL